MKNNCVPGKKTLERRATGFTFLQISLMSVLIEVS